MIISNQFRIKKQRYSKHRNYSYFATQGIYICIIVLLATFLLAGCSAVKSSDSGKDSEKNTSQTSSDQKSEREDGTISYSEKETANSDSKTDSKTETTNDSTLNSSTTVQKNRYQIDAKYKQLLAKADDENDFRYASDFQQKTRIYLFGHDASSYMAIFGYNKPSEQEIYNTIDNNNSFSDEDKQFIKEFVTDWLTLYPESDLTVFNYNLQTLKIERLSSEVIKARTLSTGTVACYIDWLNEIYLDENANINDKSSNDYVALVHELLHSCRQTKTQIGDVNIKTHFYEDKSFGMYENEVLATYYAFKLRQYHVPDAEMKSIYYTLQCSIYRILLPLIDYDGSDYMNHSVNYFIEKIQDCFYSNGIKAEAYHFVNLVDSQALMHYEPYNTPDFTEFEELFEILVDIYASTHLTSDMTDEELREEFNIFWEDLSFNLDKLTNPYSEMKKSTFEGYWNLYVDNMKGVSVVEE